MASAAHIIEFIGPTSSGKSTYVRQLLRESGDLGIPVVLAEEYFLGRLGNVISAKIPRSLCVDFIVLTRLIGSVYRNRALISELLRVSIARNDSLLMRLNIARNAIKRLAMFDHLTIAVPEKIVIFDEGPLQACMNIFVHYEEGVEEQRLLDVTSGLRLPSVIVVVSADDDEIVSRSAVRSDKAFEGLSDHHWLKIKEEFERVVPKILARNRSVAKVVNIVSTNPVAAEDFWKDVGFGSVRITETSTLRN